MWIESHQELAQHPKTKKAARLLGAAIPCVIGHLHLLWWWAMDYADDGDLTGFDPVDLADAALWEGDPERFIAALLECGIPGGSGFLACEQGRLVIHDWDVYAGKLLAQRAKNAERQKRYRDRQQQSETHIRDVTVTSPSRNPATVPNRTGPDRTLTNVSAPIASEPEENAPAGAPPGGGSRADAPVPLNGSYHRFVEELQGAKNRAEKVATLTRAFGCFYEVAPDGRTAYKRIGALANKLNSADALLRVIIQSSPSWPRVDDPLDWLSGAVENRRDEKRNGHQRAERSEPYYRDWAEVKKEQEEEWPRNGAASS